MAGQKGRSGGQNRLPNSIKETRGTLKQSQRNLKEPKPTPGIPLPPDCLSDEEIAAYHDIGRDVKLLNTCSIVDQKALALAASAFVDWRTAWKKVKREGLTLLRETREGQTTIANPAVAARNDAWRRFQSALRAFGLDPQSRGSVSALPGDDEASEFYN